MNNTPDFSQISDVLLNSHSPYSTAEAHGIICGMICGDEKTNGYTAWIKHPLSKLDANHTLKTLCQETSVQLEAINFNFSLLLPSDEFPLETQTEGLLEWCEGFLSGLKFSGIDLNAPPEEIQEILNDLIDISLTDPYNLEDQQFMEEDFIEVLEYVRMATLFIFTELRLKK
jgi:uncharacterized protein YgfB (UPF0149 family)